MTEIFISLVCGIISNILTDWIKTRVQKPH